MKPCELCIDFHLTAMDRLPPKRRSWLMAQVKSKNTGPELIVRKIVWALGYRYRLHVANLPGKPNIVVTRLKKIIEVRGCFWHRHGCKMTTTPKSKLKFWQAKFRNNVERDRENMRNLRKENWKVLEIWQCELKDADKTRKRIHEFLETK